MTIGFKSDKKNKIAKINEKEYKVLKADLKESDIEDINI